MRTSAAQPLALRLRGKDSSAERGEGSVTGPAAGVDSSAGRSGPMLPVLAACLGISALTLLFPSTPTYDPWAWIMWGREIVHLDLVTEGGPSWKPLPVLFTVPFSLVGDDAAPMLWLWIARAGALLSLVMAFRLGRRLSGGGAAGCRGRRVRHRLPAHHLPVRARLDARQLRGDARRGLAVGLRAASRRPPRPRALPRLRRRPAAPRGVALPRHLWAVAVVPRSRASPARGGGRAARARPLVRPRAVGLGRAAARLQPREQPEPWQRRLRRASGARGRQAVRRAHRDPPLRRGLPRRRCGGRGLGAPPAASGPRCSLPARACPGCCWWRS